MGKNFRGKANKRSKKESSGKIVGYTKLGTPIWRDREDNYILIGDAYLPCGYCPEPYEDDLLVEENSANKTPKIWT